LNAFKDSHAANLRIYPAPQRKIQIVFPLAENAAGFYVRGMKRISFFLAAALFALPAVVRAQDAATEERLNKLSAQIQDLVEMQSAQSKRIEALSKELQNMQQEQSSKPAANYASEEDLKQLAAKLKEVDRKRQEDSDLILEQLKKLGKNISGPVKKPVALPPPKPADAGGATAPATPDKVFEYELKSGDTLSAIVKAYAEKNIKVTVKQILDANPGLDEKKLKPGKTIIIPAPQ
jgi:nucleoid-associated protein YgaU